MPIEAVTTHDVSRARFLLEQVSAALLEADPQMRDDDALFLDMLDGVRGQHRDLGRHRARLARDGSRDGQGRPGGPNRPRRLSSRRPALTGYDSRTGHSS